MYWMKHLPQETGATLMLNGCTLREKPIDGGSARRRGDAYGNTLGQGAGPLFEDGRARLAMVQLGG